jgi:hypothetical protein
MQSRKIISVHASPNTATARATEQGQPENPRFMK